MRLEIGKPDYPIEGDVARAEIQGTRPNKPIKLVYVKPSEIAKMRARHPHLRGVPDCFALGQDQKTKKRLIMLHPAPSAPFWLEIYPPDPEVKEAA